MTSTAGIGVISGKSRGRRGGLCKSWTRFCRRRCHHGRRVVVDLQIPSCIARNIFGMNVLEQSVCGWLDHGAPVLFHFCAGLQRFRGWRFFFSFFISTRSFRCWIFVRSRRLQSFSLPPSSAGWTQESEDCLCVMVMKVLDAMGIGRLGVWQRRSL